MRQPQPLHKALRSHLAHRSRSPIHGIPACALGLGILNVVGLVQDDCLARNHKVHGQSRNPECLSNHGKTRSIPECWTTTLRPRKCDADNCDVILTLLCAAALCLLRATGSSLAAIGWQATNHSEVLLLQTERGAVHCTIKCSLGYLMPVQPVIPTRSFCFESWPQISALCSSWRRTRAMRTGCLRGQSQLLTAVQQDDIHSVAEKKQSAKGRARRLATGQSCDNHASSQSLVRRKGAKHWQRLWKLRSHMSYTWCLAGVDASQRLLKQFQALPRMDVMACPRGSRRLT